MPSMSSAPRLAQCTSRCTRCAGQSTFTQWWFASPSTRTSGCLHSGHFFGNFHGFVFGGRLADDRADHFGDDVARAPHDDRVAGPDVFALHVVFVVQRRHADVHAADEHRLQDRERSRASGAADADHDVAQHRRLLFGRELVRDRPARRPRRESHLLALAVVVDLHDDAVDLVTERVALRLDVARRTRTRLRGRRTPRCSG